MTDKYFKRIFFVLSAFVFIVAIIRAVVVPFCYDEIATFFYYVQRGRFLPYTPHADTNNHILNSFLAWICFHCFGDSPFSLRIPNLLALIIFIIAVYRLAGKLTQTSSKVILVAGLLFSFRWLSFFSMCRGYGISMALLTLAFSYIPDYIENKKLFHALVIYALLDLAVCANLTLIIAVLISTGLICFFQLYHHRFLKIGNILGLCIHAAVILFWVKYSFFLQDNHLLYAGAGDSYWYVTFESLIYAIVGKQNSWINGSIVFSYIVLMALFFYSLIKNRKGAYSRQILTMLFLGILLNGLIIGFYLLKKLCGVNFPENRTALFFYLLFILNAVFIIDVMKPRFSNTVSVIAVVGFMAHFIWNFNFSKHSLDMYAVIPQRFYTRLLQEQKQCNERITIGGTKFKDFLFEFMNYRNNAALNNMDLSDNYNNHGMMMNADYYVAFKRDRKYYEPYYQEIDTDKYCGFTLLKRKQPLARKLLFDKGSQYITANKKEEYFNFFELKDTTFNNRNPLLVEFNFKVQNGNMPSCFWLVIQVDSLEGKPLYYRSIPFERTKYNWLDKEGNSDFILETGPLPAKIHRFVAYLWNSQHQEIQITMNSVKVFQLEGFGADVADKYWIGYF